MIRCHPGPLPLTPAPTPLTASADALAYAVEIVASQPGAARAIRRVRTRRDDGLCTACSRRTRPCGPASCSPSPITHKHSPTSTE